MEVCKYVCMHVCMYVCMKLCVCVYVCVYECMYACMYVCECLHVFVGSVCINMYVCMHVCINVCMYVCILLQPYRRVCFAFKCAALRIMQRFTRFSSPPLSTAVAIQIAAPVPPELTHAWYKVVHILPGCATDPRWSLPSRIATHSVALSFPPPPHWCD